MTLRTLGTNVAALNNAIAGQVATEAAARQTSDASMQSQINAFTPTGRFQGTYNAANTYVAGDQVVYSGSLYGASGAVAAGVTPGTAPWVAIPTDPSAVHKTDPGVPIQLDTVSGELVRIDAADGSATWLQASATDGGPTTYAAGLVKTSIGIPAGTLVTDTDSRLPKQLDTADTALVRIDAADGTSTWLQADATDGGPTSWAMSMISARLSGAGSTYGRNLAQSMTGGTTTDIGALINSQYGLGYRHLIVPYNASPWPSLTTFTVPAGCSLEFEPGARIANNMSGTGGSVIYGTLVGPVSFTSTAFTVPSSSADASSNDYAYPSRETLFKDGSRLVGDYYHEYATTGVHVAGKDVVLAGNIHGKNMRHRTGWGQVFHIEADNTEASQIYVLGRIYGEDSDRNVEIEDGTHDVHILGGGYAKNIFPNGYTGQPTDTSVGDHAAYANYTFVWDMGHAHDFSGTGGATYVGPQRIIFKGGFVAENCGGALTCLRSVGTSSTTIPRDNSMDELHVIGRGQSTGAEEVSLGGINCRVGRVVLSEGAGIAGGTFRVKQLATGSNNRVGEVTGTTTAMAALVISDDATGFKVGGAPTQQWP